MIPGDVVPLAAPQAGGGAPKARPAVVLADLPGPYQTMLLCGISTRAHHIRKDWDEPIGAGDPDFKSSGLHQNSVIRLSYLLSATVSDVISVIGQIDPNRLLRLRTRLWDHLRP